MSGVGQEGRTLDALAMLGFAINGDEALIWLAHITLSIGKAVSLQSGIQRYIGV